MWLLYSFSLRFGIRLNPRSTIGTYLANPTILSKRGEEQMNTVLFGWLTFIGITLSTLLYLQNHFNPNQTKTRVNTHCTIAKLTIITLTAHLLSQPIEGWGTMWGIWSGIGFYLIIMASGIVLLYIPDAGSIRYHARSFHSALVVGLAAAIIHHVLTMYGILA